MADDIWDVKDEIDDVIKESMERTPEQARIVQEKLDALLLSIAQRTANLRRIGVPRKTVNYKN